MDHDLWTEDDSAMQVPSEALQMILHLRKWAAAAVARSTICGAVLWMVVHHPLESVMSGRNEWDTYTVILIYEIIGCERF